MTPKPASLFWVAGFFMFMGCAPNPASDTVANTGSSTSSSGNVDLWSACSSYCNHVYGTAADCENDELVALATGCHAFCDVQTASVSSECVAAATDAYQCIVDEAVPYACLEGSSSPEPTTDVCESQWASADECIRR